MAYLKGGREKKTVQNFVRKRILLGIKSREREKSSLFFERRLTCVSCIAFRKRRKNIVSQEKKKVGFCVWEKEGIFFSSLERRGEAGVLDTERARKVRMILSFFPQACMTRTTEQLQHTVAVFCMENEGGGGGGKKLRILLTPGTQSRREKKQRPSSTTTHWQGATATADRVALFTPCCNRGKKNRGKKCTQGLKKRERQGDSYFYMKMTNHCFGLNFFLLFSVIFNQILRSKFRFEYSNFFYHKIWPFLISKISFINFKIEA